MLHRSCSYGVALWIGAALIVGPAAAAPGSGAADTDTDGVDGPEVTEAPEAEATEEGSADYEMLDEPDVDR